MDETPDWLPELELLSEYGGDWDQYLEAIYSIFCKDFIDSKPVFRGQPLALKRHPVVDGKEATFWHMTSEGSVESERIPDFRRCERIRWPRPVIEHEQDPALKVWSEKRGNENRIHLWFESEGYLVVLAERTTYTLPWTAFYIERQHQRDKYTKRWKRNTGRK